MKIGKFSLFTFRWHDCLYIYIFTFVPEINEDRAFHLQRKNKDFTMPSVPNSRALTSHTRKISGLQTNWQKREKRDELIGNNFFNFLFFFRKKYHLELFR